MGTVKFAVITIITIGVGIFAGTSIVDGQIAIEGLWAMIGFIFIAAVILLVTYVKKRKRR